MLGGCQSKYSPDRLGLPKAGGHVDCDAIGQRNHRADTRDCHETPAHIIVPDNGQQAALQDADLLAKRPPDNEQRSTRTAKSGRFSTSSLMRASNFTFPATPTLRPKLRKVARRSFSMATAFDCSSLR